MLLEEAAEVEVEAAQGVGVAEVALKLQHQDGHATPGTKIARSRQARNHQTRRSKGLIRAVEAVQATVAIARPMATRRKRFHYRVIATEIKPPSRHHQHALQVVYANSLPRRADVGMVINATICTR